MFHLVFGNALIGMGEGLLIAAVFKRPKLPCVGLMMAANYFSAWVGGVWLAGSIATRLDWNLYNAWRLFWAFALGTYIVTLLLELPLIALCFWKQDNWFKRSLQASLLAQTISYACLFGWYWGASGKSLYTQMQIVPASEIHLPANLQLFYISSQDGRVHENSRELRSIVSTNGNDRLLITTMPDHTNSWSLMLRLDADRDEDVRFISIEPVIEGAAAAVEPIEEHRQNGRDTWFNFGPALKANSDLTSEWTFATGFWPVEGMVAENEKRRQKFHFAWETPFSQWNIRSAIQLPDDHVIFQLGNDQICVLEPHTKRIALLAKGRGPAVVMK
jgi:hypothetical protein